MKKAILGAVGILLLATIWALTNRSSTSDVPVPSSGTGSGKPAQVAQSGVAPSVAAAGQPAGTAAGVADAQVPAAKPSAPTEPVPGVPLTKEEAAKTPAYYGTFPAVSAQANESTRSVAEALQDKKHPERLSPLILPKPYDDAEFEKDKLKYCNTVEPGRAFQSAQPGPGVPRLQGVSSALSTIAQGEQVALQVRSKPAKPVTLVAFDGGRFAENQLNTVTVVADQNGVATAHYEATTGVISEVNIQAASPVASGQIHFIVNVTKPNIGTQP